MSKIIVCDLEGNGLLNDITKVHCIVMNELGTDNWYEVTHDHKRRYLKSIKEGYTYVWHNGLGYDHPVLNKLYNINYHVHPDTINGVSVQHIDTLVLSRELWPDRLGGHSLQKWGERLSIKKPEVEDWSDQPLEVYVDRCREDVKITGATLEYLLKETEIDY